MKINKHGLNIKGIKRAAGCTVDMGRYDGYLEIWYDTESGRIAVYELDNNSYMAPNGDTTLIRVAGTRHHLTMQELADLIAEAVEERKAEREAERDAETKFPGL